jgi:hypothetical protein
MSIPLGIITSPSYNSSADLSRAITDELYLTTPFRLSQCNHKVTLKLGLVTSRTPPILVQSSSNLANWV